MYYTSMPQVSRIKLDKKAEDQLVKTLELVLAKLSREEEMKDFLLSLLTPTERIMLAKRLAMTILINEGLSDSNISSSLNLTRATISKMRLFLEVRGEGFKHALRKLENEKAMQELKGVLAGLTRYAVRAAGGRI
jgi:uncharacterized protein YerC